MASTGCLTQSLAVSSPCSPHLRHCCAEQCRSAAALLNRTCKALFTAGNNSRFQRHTVSCACLCRLMDYSLLLDKEPKQGGTWAACAKRSILKSLQSLLVEDAHLQWVYSAHFLGVLVESSLSTSYRMIVSMTNGCLPLPCHAGDLFTGLRDHCLPCLS